MVWLSLASIFPNKYNYTIHIFKIFFILEENVWKWHNMVPAPFKYQYCCQSFKIWRWHLLYYLYSHSLSEFITLCDKNKDLRAHNY